MDAECCNLGRCCPKYVHRRERFLSPEPLLEIQKVKFYTRPMESESVFYFLFLCTLKFMKQWLNGINLKNVAIQFIFTRQAHSKDLQMLTFPVSEIAS